MQSLAYYIIPPVFINSLKVACNNWWNHVVLKNVTVCEWGSTGWAKDLQDSHANTLARFKSVMGFWEHCKNVVKDSYG